MEVADIAIAADERQRARVVARREAARRAARAHRAHRRPSKAHHRTATRPSAPSKHSRPPRPSNGAVPTIRNAPATAAQVRRLLWRAGFGPKRGQVESLTGRPILEVIDAFVAPRGNTVLRGPEPNNAGKVLDPINNWGDDHCWWLDRMVRSNHQLVERMTFIWHDWFATSNDQVGSSQLMLDQNATIRSLALGSFHTLFEAITTDPAMLVFLNGIQNTASDPNENYGREMMELFSLGADRGAYTETDVREMARALSGWTADWTDAGLTGFRFDPSLHDAGDKKIFGRSGPFGYRDAVALCVEHPLHASFFVEKLWGYFVPVPPDKQTLAALQGLYLRSRFSVVPVVRAILAHPDFFGGPEMVIPPVVYTAGLLRSIGRGIDTNAWAWLNDAAGQLLFHPPNVSGWNFDAWLDTTTLSARWNIANYVVATTYVNPWATVKPVYDPTETPPAALTAALRYWDNPSLSPGSLRCLNAFAVGSMSGVNATWEQGPYRAMRQNALRMLIATAPDSQVC